MAGADSSFQPLIADSSRCTGGEAHLQVPDSELEFVHVICQSQQIEEDFGGDSGHCCVLAADISEILLVQEVLVHGRLLELNSSEEVDDKVEVVPLLALLIDLLLEVHLM